MKTFKWSLINDNIIDEDKLKIVNFVTSPNVRFTQSRYVKEFENKWSGWLGIKHTTFVNSGASANWVMASALRETVGVGEVIMSPLGWVSDIVPFLELGFTPVFVDIDPRTMSIDVNEVKKAITPSTKAVLAIHVLGFNALTDELLDVCNRLKIMLLEDCCEAHGATFDGKKVGTHGLMSNFSFYFGHHMTTIEGGTVCTNDDEVYEIVRMLRSHGMTREASVKAQQKYQDQYPQLNPLFTFAVPGYNVRSTEINAVLGISQLHRLDENIRVRCDNLQTWLHYLSEDKFVVDYQTEGSSNFSLPLVLKKKSAIGFLEVQRILSDADVEFRLGTAGGGNQSMQPYLVRFRNNYHQHNMQQLNHIHEFGLYVGNHTEVTTSMIQDLCQKLNQVEIS